MNTSWLNHLFLHRKASSSQRLTSSAISFSSGTRQALRIPGTESIGPSSNLTVRTKTKVKPNLHINRLIISGETIFTDDWAICSLSRSQLNMPLLKPSQKMPCTKCRFRSSKYSHRNFTSSQYVC